MDKTIIAKRIDLMVKYLNKLQEFEQITIESYLNNFETQIITERSLQLIVEIASDINTYLLVQLYQITPETYFDSFIEAGKQGIISRELASELAQSGGMRNILVHQYIEIDHEIVFAAIPKALTQYKRYLREITNFVNSLEANNG